MHVAARASHTHPIDTITCVSSLGSITTATEINSPDSLHQFLVITALNPLNYGAKELNLMPFRVDMHVPQLLNRSLDHDCPSHCYRQGSHVRLQTTTTYVN